MRAGSVPQFDKDGQQRDVIGILNVCCCFIWRDAQRKGESGPSAEGAARRRVRLGITRAYPIVRLPSSFGSALIRNVFRLLPCRLRFRLFWRYIGFPRTRGTLCLLEQGLWLPFFDT